MAPNYRPEQVVLALRPWRELVIGDVIVFQHDKLEKIKRIRSLHDDGVYVIGDNASASSDSSVFGLITYQSVAAIVVWPRRLPLLSQPSNFTNV